MKKILITGGAGYVGCILARKLLEAGYFVRVIDPLIFGRAPVRELEKNPAFDLVVGLTEDRYILEKCLDGVYAVVHLSGLSNDPSCEINADLTRKANVEATRVLLKLSKEAGVARLIYASSCSVYGFTADGVMVDETSPLNPLTAYAKSKIDAEDLLLPEAGDDLVVTSLRKATLYGPSPRMRFDLVVNTMTGSGLRDRVIKVNGGEQWRPFLHVADSADAYIFMIETDRKKINGQIFNVGSNDQNRKIIDLAHAVSRQIPGAEVRQSNSPDNRSYHVNFDKIESVGWQTKIDIDAGIGHVVKLLTDNPQMDFRDLNYFNIKRMITYLNI